MTVYLYHLVVDGTPMYIGLTCNVSERRSAHRRSRPAHQFVVVQSFEDVGEAALAEVNQIAQHNTYQQGWNKSPGGDYEGNSGYNRTGIGGVKRGNVPWNAGKKGVFSEHTRRKWSEKRRGKIHSSKLTSEQLTEIKLLFASKPNIAGAGQKSKNGRVLPYKRAFAHAYSEQYKVTSANIYRIIKNEA